MNEFLAQYYGTGVAQAEQPTESAEKLAQAELFSKLAADNGIDLNQLNEEQIQQLWDATFSKTAEEEAKEHEEHESKKKEKAEEELAEKKAASEKFAEADFLGRVMAHSYVQELDKIAKAKEVEKGISGFVKKIVGTPARKGVSAYESMTTGKPAATAHAATGAHAVKEKLHDYASHYGKKLKEHPGKTHAALAVGAGLAGAGAAHAATKEKKASALDELALFKAIEKVAENGFNTEEAATKLSEVFDQTGGELPNGTKVASAENLDMAVEIRSLEFLEAAGYPVTWNI